MIISIIIFIFTLLVLVIIHELGHFLMAKRFGIKVEEFGFGIPPRIFGKKIGETVYSLNALPLGGFVRLLGEDEIEKKVFKNPRSFASKKPWQRILVVVAGVTMNLILAWALFYTVIISQNFKIIYPALEPAVYIAQTEKDYPAEKAGLKVGDKLLSVDGKEVNEFEQARNLIKDKKGEAVNLKVSDSGGKNLRELAVIPKEIENGDFLIGVIFSPIPFKTYSTATEKIFSGTSYSWDLTRLIFMGLGQTLNNLFQGQFQTVSQSVSGPVGLASMTNNILSGGLQAVIPYLWFVGVISLTLSIFNVLPIPALDGGRLFFLIIEAVTRKKVHAGVERWIHTIGMVLLLTLAVFVTFSDVRKLLP